MTGAVCVYSGGQLSQMTVTTVTETADGQTTTETHTVDLTYDASGNPQTMTYDGTTYYTVNIQGDVTGIVDESGNVLARYNYQAYGTTYYYGVPTGSVGPTLRQINPLTYRGYVYDKETKLYYLQSRYYNRTSGRFLNADAFTSTGQGLLGNNMFAYCGNNPINRIDPAGNIFTRIYYTVPSSRPPAYVQVDSTDVNCYNYVLGLEGTCDPGDYSLTINGEKQEEMYENGKLHYTVEQVANFAIRDIKKMGRDAFPIECPSDAPDGYYVIAVKTSDKISKLGVCDYHFVVMVDAYVWADKPCSGEKSRCGAIIPSWSVWDKMDEKGYYNSHTVYIAVEGKWPPTW